MNAIGVKGRCNLCGFAMCLEMKSGEYCPNCFGGKLQPIDTVGKFWEIAFPEKDNLESVGLRDCPRNSNVGDRCIALMSKGEELYDLMDDDEERMNVILAIERTMMVWYHG